MTTRSSTKEAKGAARPAEEQLATLAAVQGGALSAMTQAGQAYVEGIVELNRELAHFVQARWQRDLELGQSLAKCRDWNEAAELQQDWVQTATQEYFAEASEAFFGTNDMYPFVRCRVQEFFRLHRSSP